VHTIKSCAGIFFLALKLNLSLFASQTDARKWDNKDLLVLLKENSKGEFIQLAPILFARPNTMTTDEFLKSPVLVNVNTNLIII
jgi:hypothetical protein